ncbi:MAG: hypothetical protein J6C20_07630 [Paludibacteraceae bacterium]|nr:hypothetical protein [Paludibacteraceae bacterium]
MNLRLVNTITVRADFDELSKIVVNFAYPSNSSERGTNENRFGLIRHYKPKGSDLA